MQLAAIFNAEDAEAAEELPATENIHSHRFSLRPLRSLRSRPNEITFGIRSKLSAAAPIEP
jgi:hypothetical protein